MEKRMFSVPGGICDFQLRRLAGSVLLTLSMIMPLQGLAQVTPNGESLRLSPGDVILVSVPGQPEFSGALTLDPAGKAPVPQIGDVALAGLTPAEAELVLRQRLRLYDPSIETVGVVLMSSLATGMKVFLIGQVANPGEFTFNKIPTMWEILIAAGGPVENANLRQVRLIREVEGSTQVSQYDFSGLIDGGDTPTINLLSGDTIVIPALLEGVSGVPTSNGVKVFGAVEVPTVVEITKPTRLMDVLMLAGAPTGEAELGEIFWVHDVGDVPQARIVDMEMYLMYGDLRGNPLVYPGDTVRVEFYEDPWFRRTLPLILGTLVSAATLWLLYDRITNEGVYAY
jgi:protein involved in polysaccharide export with SLBB domain